MSAYLELVYQRSEDGTPVTLLANLPTVRRISIGGTPGDLRLPGIEPERSFAQIVHSYDHFIIEPTGDELVTVNDVRIDESGVALSEGDVIRIEKYNLTFHPGEINPEQPLLDTPLRWKLRRPEAETSSQWFGMDSPSRPYIDEFHLMTRPLAQQMAAAEIQKVAESEIRRIVRSDEGELLDGYVQFLWWTRVRMAREAGDSRAVDIAREALDLYPHFTPLSVAVGVTLLTTQDWVGAKKAFHKALEKPAREFIVSMHDARVGRVLARHLVDMNDKNLGMRPPDRWHRDDWNVPEIHLHAPGDELTMWRIARYGRVFGALEHCRFGYRGVVENTDGAREITQRWDLFDVSRNIVTRRLVKMPQLMWADPSLVLEVGFIREYFEKEDPGAMHGVIDLSSDPPIGRATPVLFDPSAASALPRVRGADTTCVRIWTVQSTARDVRVNVHVVPQPEPDDVVYAQGDLCVAVAQPDAKRLDGCCLYGESGRRPKFFLQTPTGQRMSTDYRVTRRPAPQLSRPQAIISAGIVLIGIVCIAISAVMRAADQ